MTLAEQGLIIRELPYELLGSTGNRPAGVSLLEVYKAPYTDSTGIPLSSDRDEELIEGIDFRYRPSPFSKSPSRYPNGQPHLKQMSGLESDRLREHYLTVLSLLDDARTSYIKNVLRRTGTAAENPLTVGQSRQLLQAIQFSPHFYAYRASDPRPVQGHFHPAVLISSNSASGSSGALEAYVEKYRVSSTAIPDPDKMVEAAEESGAMVGKKTICPASPPMMRHYFKSIVYGSNLPQDHRVDTGFIFDPKQIMFMVRFGEHAYEAHNVLDGLKGKDNQVAARIAPHAKPGHNPRRYRRNIEEFLTTCSANLTFANMQQNEANIALGRAMIAPQITLDNLEPWGFEMPAILRRLRSSKLIL